MKSNWPFVCPRLITLYYVWWEIDLKSPKHQIFTLGKYRKAWNLSSSCYFWHKASCFKYRDSSDEHSDGYRSDDVEKANPPLKVKGTTKMSRRIFKENIPKMFDESFGCYYSMVSKKKPKPTVIFFKYIWKKEVTLEKTVQRALGMDRGARSQWIKWSTSRKESNKGQRRNLRLSVEMEILFWQKLQKVNIVSLYLWQFYKWHILIY